MRRNCYGYLHTAPRPCQVGLPAKSGVSGCVLLVVPNLMGICLWSPPLDANGNSCRGVQFCNVSAHRAVTHFWGNNNYIIILFFSNGADNIHMLFIHRLPFELSLLTPFSPAPSGAGIPVHLPQLRQPAQQRHHQERPQGRQGGVQGSDPLRPALLGSGGRPVRTQTVSDGRLAARWEYRIGVVINSLFSIKNSNVYSLLIMYYVP